MRQSKRDELVRKALIIFYQNGFHATGMDTLAAESGISKTSMYKHFRTKDELILAVLRLRDENFRNWLFRRIDDLADTPRDKLTAIFDALHEWFSDEEYKGCMFIKASAEYQEKEHAIHAQSTEHKRLVLERVTQICRDAGAPDPRNLAKQLLILKEGAIVMAVLGSGSAAAMDAQSAARSIIANSLPITK